MNHPAIPADLACGYCFEAPAVEWDHMLPRSRGGRNRAANRMPSCHACNVWFGSKVYATIEAKRAARQAYLAIRARLHSTPCMGPGADASPANLPRREFLAPPLGPPTRPPDPLRRCVQCGAGFKPHRPAARYCGGRCRILAWRRRHRRPV